MSRHPDGGSASNLRWFFIAGACFFIGLRGLFAASDQTVALKAARMFDGKSNILVSNAVVIVQDGKIIDVGSNVSVPAGAQVIDLGDATLSPGFIDAHTHLTSDFSGNYNERRLKNLDLNVSEQAIKSTINARVTIEAGFTTVRDLGSRFEASPEFVDVALRNSIDKGVVVGPRMLVATKGIGATGGHFDPSAGFRDKIFGQEPDYTDGIVDSPDDVRKAVRFEVKNGANVIKAAKFPAAFFRSRTKLILPQLEHARGNGRIGR